MNSNKTLFSLLAILLLPLSLFAQTLTWATRTGAKWRDVSTSFEFDAAGNIITTGSYGFLVDFDPGPGVFNLGSLEVNYNIFIQKLDPSGHFLWAKSIGGPGTDQANDMVMDPAGNFYLTGYFQDAVDFDPGPGTYVLDSKGYFDTFVCKLDSAGNLIWARSMGNSTSKDSGKKIAVDGAGNVYTTGLFEFDVDFDPGPDTFLIKGSFQDVFIQKLDANGNFQWARKFGELYNDEVADLKITSDGQVLVFGHVTGTPKFGALTITDSITVDGTDPFLLRIDPDGHLIWAKHFGGPSLDLSTFMQLDTDGNIYTSGAFRGTADLDPGPDSFLLTSVGISNYFLQKLDPAGQFIWAMPYPPGVYPTGLERDAADNLILVGGFQGTADLDPGPAVQKFTALGAYDFFVQQLDPDREMVWVQVSGGTETDGISDVQIDTSGAIFLTGAFRDSLDADPGPGHTILRADGSNDDFFLLKWQRALLYRGRVFNDLNNNQVYDAGEPPLPNVVLAVPGEGQYASTNSLGKFHFNADLAGDTLTAVMPRHIWTATPAFYLPDSNQTSMDFAVHIQPDVQDVAVTAIALTPFRPGRETEVLIQVRNNGSARTDSFPVTFSMADLNDWITLKEAEPMPWAVLGDSLVWQLDSLEVDSVALIRLTFKTSSKAIPDTEIPYVAEALLAADPYPQDNRFEVTTAIVGSYDPNDKQVSPGLFSPLLLDSIALRYVIRFQNTGNFPADRVQILDTLPEGLDVRTLQVIGTSHPCVWRLTGDRVLDFLFDNIALPDSNSNEPASHGFAAFTIQPRRDLEQGDSVLNRAAIYFDFNAPVLTNHATTSVDRDQDGDGFFSQADCNDLAASVNPAAVEIPGNGVDENCDGQDGVVANEEVLPMPLLLWPNPVRDQLLVGFGAPETGVLEAWTADGRLLLRQRVEGRAYCRILIGDYPRGMCLLRFRSDEGRRMTGRVVLE